MSERLEWTASPGLERVEVGPFALEVLDHPDHPVFGLYKWQVTFNGLLYASGETNFRHDGRRLAEDALTDLCLDTLKSIARNYTS